MSRLLDFEYIRKKISIVEVASQLGLVVNGYRAHCWRKESHRNGDASPSIAFRKKQNTGRCFVCDDHTWSNLDLVMLYLSCDLRAAAEWIKARFTVPTLQKGDHVIKRQAWHPHFRASDTDSVVDALVRCGIWASLSNAERSILPALFTFSDRDSGLAEISYRGLMRFSGVGSPATISGALRHFEQMKFLKVIRTRGLGPVRRVGRYHFTFDDPDFQSMVGEALRRQRDEIALQRELQLEARRARYKSSAPVQVILSSLTEVRPRTPPQTG
ncbi:hypothetical protein [Granulicella aggregans]|uniref:hypothetical protein n=1 Tax=Granulicella aggregans TaxID=474949 RepID=UPI0021E0BF92|nr:hypothetical protein [Granulicella aggregans]